MTVAVFDKTVRFSVCCFVIPDRVAVITVELVGVRTVGVPEMIPVVALIENPAGSPVAEKFETTAYGNNVFALTVRVPGTLR